MGNWFGNLSIAYKYTVVFMSLLGLTIIAGGFKVLYNRHMLRKYAKAQKDVETGREEVVELNAREKDEGDLFGVRAIEAGFTAGIAQSRPTSRASSFVGTSSTSTNTLVGGFYSPKILTHSPATSINSIGLSLGHDGNNSEGFGAKRASPPVSKLLPSDAELNGRINHNAAVNMSLTIPPSPVHSRDPSSPALPGEGDNDGNVSPRSLPRAPRFNHYTPARSKVPMQEAPQVSVHAPEDMSRSPSPPHAPEANMPRMPAKALGDGHRLAFPANSSLRTQPESTPPPVRLLALTYQPTHKKTFSNASSVYSDKRRSSNPMEGSKQQQHGRSRSNSSGSSAYNFSLPDYSRHNSTASANLTNPKEQDLQPPPKPNTLLAPRSAAGDLPQSGDPRLSEFYDAYYRYSQLPAAKKTEQKDATEVVPAHETIQEVPSPSPSPKPHSNYGMAI